jgi:hypothetical protein
MLPIDAHTPSSLEWKQQSAFGRYYELKGGDTVYAAIEFVKRFGSLAEAHTAAGGWTFKRRGMMSPVVSARLKGSESDVIVYKPNWSASKGEMILAGGEVLQFKSESFWGKDWVLSSADAQPLLRFSTKGMVKHEAGVTVELPGRARPDLALLLTFCWYLLLLYQQDSAATVAVIPG